MQVRLMGVQTGLEKAAVSTAVRLRKCRLNELRLYFSGFVLFLPYLSVTNFQDFFGVFHDLRFSSFFQNNQRSFNQVISQPLCFPKKKYFQSFSMTRTQIPWLSGLENNIYKIPWVSRFSMTRIRTLVSLVPASRALSQISWHLAWRNTF